MLTICILYIVPKQDHTHKYVVLVMGNPWVTQAQPVPHPAKPIPTHVGRGIFGVWVWVPVGSAGNVRGTPCFPPFSLFPLCLSLFPPFGPLPFRSPFRSAATPISQHCSAPGA